MSLFSFLRKNGQESTADDGAYYSRAEEDTKAARSRKRKTTARRDDAADPVLPEKKRARRRLVGAVALVLAAIIGLPMMLDSEPRPLADDIAIQIPARDSLPPIASPTDSQTAAPVAAPDTSPIPAQSETVAASLDAKEELVKTPPTLSTDKSASTAAESATATAPAASRPEPSPASAPAVPAPKSLAPRSDDGARALALLQGRPDPGKTQPGEKFVIQVAALVSQQKVNELQAELKRAGIDSFTQKVATQSGSATRIRVGPFPSREEAEKVRGRIVKLGLNGTLVPA